MKNNFKIGSYAKVINHSGMTKLRIAKEHGIDVFIENTDSDGIYYHFWHDDVSYQGYGAFQRFEPINGLESEAVEL